MAPNGIRIAGDFGTNGALSSGLSMLDWNPTDVSGAMSDPDGDNIWSITVDYGSSHNGIQYYKFVNGDWGGDESVSDTVCGGAGGFLQIGIGTYPPSSADPSSNRSDTPRRYLPPSASG